MRGINLTKGKVALVDDEDFEWLNQWKWCAIKGHSFNWYATRKDKNGNNIIMHRLILNPPNGLDSDHINHNGLDNRRVNLRACTNKQNSQNRIPYKGTTSRFKGVSWIKRDKKWVSQITLNRKHIHLGYFTTESDAAITYDRAAIRYFGEFAMLNKI